MIISPTKQITVTGSGIPLLKSSQRENNHSSSSSISSLFVSQTDALSRQFGDGSKSFILMMSGAISSLCTQSSSSFLSSYSNNVDSHRLRIKLLRAFAILEGKWLDKWHDSVSDIARVPSNIMDEEMLFASIIRTCLIATCSPLAATTIVSLLREWKHRFPLTWLQSCPPFAVLSGSNLTSSYLFYGLVLVDVQWRVAAPMWMMKNGRKMGGEESSSSSSGSSDSSSSEEEEEEEEERKKVDSDIRIALVHGSVSGPSMTASGDSGDSNGMIVVSDGMEGVIRTMKEREQLVVNVVDYFVENNIDIVVCSGAMDDHIARKCFQHGIGVVTGISAMEASRLDAALKASLLSMDSSSPPILLGSSSPVRFGLVYSFRMDVKRRLCFIEPKSMSNSNLNEEELQENHHLHHGTMVIAAASQAMGEHIGECAHRAYRALKSVYSPSSPSSPLHSCLVVGAGCYEILMASEISRWISINSDNNNRSEEGEDNSLADWPYLRTAAEILHAAVITIPLRLAENAAKSGGEEEAWDEAAAPSVSQAKSRVLETIAKVSAISSERERVGIVPVDGAIIEEGGEILSGAFYLRDPISLPSSSLPIESLSLKVALLQNVIRTMLSILRLDTTVVIPARKKIQEENEE